MLENSPKIPTNLAVLLYNIRSLYNVASIFRTADAAGVQKIYLCGFTPSPLNRLGYTLPAFTKVSLGAEKFVSWDNSARSLKSTLRLIDKLKGEGWKIFAVEQNKKSVPYWKAKIQSQKEKIILIFGNELKGIPPSILKKANQILEIPMRGKILKEAGHPKKTKIGKESLNVSVAAGIVMFHLTFLPKMN